VHMICGLITLVPLKALPGLGLRSKPRVLLIYIYIFQIVVLFFKIAVFSDRCMAQTFRDYFKY
jgi:hypothetical protein